MLVTGVFLSMVFAPVQGANDRLQPLGLGLFHAGVEVYGIEPLGPSKSRFGVHFLMALRPLQTSLRWSFGGTMTEPEIPFTGIVAVKPRLDSEIQELESSCKLVAGKICQRCHAVNHQLAPSRYSWPTCNFRESISLGPISMSAEART